MLSIDFPSSHSSLFFALQTHLLVTDRAEQFRAAIQEAFGDVCIWWCLHVVVFACGDVCMWWCFIGFPESCTAPCSLRSKHTSLYLVKGESFVTRSAKRQKGACAHRTLLWLLLSVLQNSRLWPGAMRCVWSAKNKENTLSKKTERSMTIGPCSEICYSHTYCTSFLLNFATATPICNSILLNFATATLICTSTKQWLRGGSKVQWNPFCKPPYVHVHWNVFMSAVCIYPSSVQLCHLPSNVWEAASCVVICVK